VCLQGSSGRRAGTGERGDGTCCGLCQPNNESNTASLVVQRPERDCLADKNTSHADTVVVPSDSTTPGPQSDTGASTSPEDFAVTEPRGKEPDNLPSLLALAHDVTDIKVQQEADADIQVVLGWMGNGPHERG